MTGNEHKGAVRTLRLGPVVPTPRTVNLRDLGFVGAVSDEARQEIRAAEVRARRVLATAHLFRFGGRNGR